MRVLRNPLQVFRHLRAEIGDFMSRSVKDFSLLPGVHWILQVAAIKSVVSELDIIVRVQVDMAGLEGLEGQKVDNVKPVDQLVFLAGVPALRPTPEFGLRHRPSIIRDVVVLHDVFRLVKYNGDICCHMSGTSVALHRVVHGGRFEGCHCHSSNWDADFAKSEPDVDSQLAKVLLRRTL